jgi:membrane-associated protease RseP (regulator of RpoE activity)
MLYLSLQTTVTDSVPNPPITLDPAPPDWRFDVPPPAYLASLPRPSTKSFLLACVLFLLTLSTCLVAGTHFAVAYAHNQAVSWDDFVRAFTLTYRNPLALAAGLPFALTLLTILLAHELGHFFACRHHHIRASYPFFIPFPSLIGTFGAFILIRSPIRTNRALFDVGASGPLVGFVVAVPALIYGILHAKFVPGLALPADDKIVLGSPLLLQLLAPLLRHGASAANLLLHPVGRAAWVGLFATSLNLLPAAQLDGGHILRSLSQRAHRLSSVLLPLLLIFLGYRFWPGWYLWGALLLGIRFLRMLPIYNPQPLDASRRAAAFLALLVFILSFMPSPFIEH